MPAPKPKKSETEESRNMPHNVSVIDGSVLRIKGGSGRLGYWFDISPPRRDLQTWAYDRFLQMIHSGYRQIFGSSPVIPLGTQLRARKTIFMHAFLISV